MPTPPTPADASPAPTSAPTSAPSPPPTSTEYDEHVAVAAAGPDTWSAHLDAGWTVGGGLNGGYLLGVVGSAMRAAAGDKPDPLALSAVFASAATAGPAEVRTRTIRAGGTLASMAAELRQGDQGEHVRISALASYGRLDRFADDVRTTAPEPELPPLEECLPHEPPPQHRAAVRLMDRFEMRLDPGCAGFLRGRPSGRPVLQAWFRLRDREPDPLSLLQAVDALPPVTFELGMPGWAPTVELTVHVRARPAAGWLRLRHETRNMAGGMFEEDCEVWDSAGRLVAQSRQLALAPRPPT